MIRAELHFEAGTLRIERLPPEKIPDEIAPLIRFDARSGCHRARACDYAPLVIGLGSAGIGVDDHARAFAPLGREPRQWFEPRAHQNQAYEAWRANQFRGVVELPTGAGKSFLAVMAIARLQRPTLVLVPTIDLLLQWVRVLESFFGTPVGMLGGGEHAVEALTVSTYDSAVIQMEFIGNRFGLLVADECHHLPGPMYRVAAAMNLAPYRLGLSATPEGDPERDATLHDLIGPAVCKVEIDELEGSVLAEYRVVRLELPLEPDEAAAYAGHRKRYTDFLRSHGLTFRSAADWGRFVALCARDPAGREVFKSFLAQRQIARGGRAKIAKVWELVAAHAGERVLIFTADNATAYTVGSAFRWPVLTHHTGAAERKEFLYRFRDGEYPVLVTSKVLNEGVDVPAAGVGIILSGSGSVREHVQRLGRILRPAPGKPEAVLYELLSENTSELSVSERRRNHRAYAKPDSATAESRSSEK